MSKQRFNRATEHNRVQAVFTRFKKDRSGNLTNIPLYDIYGPASLKRK